MKGRLHITGGGGSVSRQADGAHSLAEYLKRGGGTETVLGRQRGKPLIPVQVHLMKGKGRIVGQNAHRIVVEENAVLRCLQHQSARPVRQMPVQGSEGQGGGRGMGNGEGNRKRPEPGELFSGLRKRFAGSQNPGDQLIGRSGVKALRNVGFIVGVSGKIQSGHIESLFIDRFGIKGIPFRHVRHADHGKMAVRRRQPVKMQGEQARHDDHLLSKGIFQVQIAAEIAAALKQRDACTHKNLPPVF